MFMFIAQVLYFGRIVTPQNLLFLPYLTPLLFMYPRTPCISAAPRPPLPPFAPSPSPRSLPHPSPSSCSLSLPQEPPDLLLNQSSRRKLGLMSFGTFLTYVLAELLDLYAYAGAPGEPGQLGVSLQNPLKVGHLPAWKCFGHPCVDACPDTLTECPPCS